MFFIKKYISDYMWNYPVPARRDFFQNRDLAFTNEESRLSRTIFFSVQLYDPGKAGQNGCLHICAKFINKFLHVLSWSKVLFFHEETSLQQKNSCRRNDEIVRYLLNSLSFYKASMEWQDLHHNVFSVILEVLVMKSRA